MSSERDFDIAPLCELDPATPPEVIYYPVRHYSPTSSRLLWELAEEFDVTAVLVEGPSDFNDRVDELLLDGHELPIALYSYVRLSDDTKRSAFYPFCEYAPEWQAQLLARDREVPFRLIDLPWAQMALETDREHRYSDEHFRHNPWPDLLCEKMNVADFDELWDVFFELDPDLDWRAYLRRCHEFCYQLRVFGAPDAPENQDREAWMVEHIDRAHAEFGGPLLVVTGGFHSSGLYAKRHGLELAHYELQVADLVEAEFEEEPEVDDDVREPPTIVEAGITLTPFTYERIDKLAGNAAGVSGPAFYQHVWEMRDVGKPLTCAPFLDEIVRRLRDKGQTASTADVIGISTTARALATLRGRSEIWRFDLVDAVSSAIVKEAQGADHEHPVMEIVHDVLRGERRGRLDDRAPLPPLVRNARRRLEELDLLPTSPTEWPITIDLENTRDRERSRTLHQARVLGLAGFQLLGGTDFVKREDLSRVWEDWSKQWSPEFEATLIENSVYGTDLPDAAAARLLERAQMIEKDAAKAAVIAIDAVLMGGNDLASMLYRKLAELVREDSDFFRVCAALGHVVYLARYDEVLGAADDPRLDELLREVYLRALWLFEGLGRVQDRDAELIAAIRALFDAFRRCYATDIDAHDDFVDVFRRVGDHAGQAPLTRGAAMGALYTLGALDLERVLAALNSFRDPVDVGDFLVGFFSLAREAAQRDPRLLQLVDEMIAPMGQQEFLETLPPLRLAFTYFTPLEKHAIVDALFGAAAAGADNVAARDAAEGEALERRIREVAATFGLRGVPDELLRLPDVPAAQSEAERDEEGSDGEAESGEKGADLGSEADDAVAAEDAVAADDTDDAGAQPGEDGDDGGSPSSEAETDRSPGDDATADAGVPGGAALTREARKERWRLILGSGAGGGLGGLGGDAAGQDRLLSYLYDREYGAQRNVRGVGDERRGSLDPSQLTVPEWINGVHELFPRRTIERLEKDALDRYEIHELVTRPDVLGRAQPNPTLLKAVLRTKHLMDREVLEMARRLVRQVVEELMEKLAREIHQPFSGARDRRRRSFLRVAKNFDARETIRRNLKHYDVAEGRLVIQEPFFFSRIRQHADRWQLIIVVDQSGSMLNSVIHAAVTAAIFCGIRALKTHLLAFDTQVIDLTDAAGDAVETLMGVQLGGGTDIAKALHCAQALVENPSRTIIVLVTDFFEGGPIEHLFAVTKSLVESGVHLLGLAALDERAYPNFDRATAGKMVELGAQVAAMTPGELAEWVADKVR